ARSRRAAAAGPVFLRAAGGRGVPADALSVAVRRGRGPGGAGALYLSRDRARMPLALHVLLLSPLEHRAARPGGGGRRAAGARRPRSRRARSGVPRSDLQSSARVRAAAGSLGGG